MNNIWRRVDIFILKVCMYIFEKKCFEFNTFFKQYFIIKYICLISLYNCIADY